MSQLGQFLKEKKEFVAIADRPRELITTWTGAVARLESRIRKVLEPYTTEGLTIDEWSTLQQDRGISYNLPALTVQFLDYQITIQPKTAPVQGPGRVEMSCGAKVVWLLWLRAEDWSYKWEYPPYQEGPRTLTDDVIEQLVQELLA
jgi:hypothetical protein